MLASPAPEAGAVGHRSPGPSSAIVRQTARPVCTSSIETYRALRVFADVVQGFLEEEQHLALEFQRERPLDARRSPGATPRRAAAAPRLSRMRVSRSAAERAAAARMSQTMSRIDSAVSCAIRWISATSPRAPPGNCSAAIPAEQRDAAEIAADLVMQIGGDPPAQTRELAPAVGLLPQHEDDPEHSLRRQQHRAPAAGPPPARGDERLALARPALRARAVSSRRRESPRNQPGQSTSSPWLLKPSFKNAATSG